jgi:anti-sigma-K factor RskA
MSGTDDTMDDTPDLLAAEYVLGTLDETEARIAERRAGAEPAFRAELRFWEARLMPLTMLAAAVPPPDTLWARIERSIAANALGEPSSLPAPANTNRLRIWQAATAACLALAAGLVGFIALRPPPPPPSFAVLAPKGVTAPMLVAFTQPDGAILVRPSASLTVPAGRDLQLWSIPAGATVPVSLGVLPATGKRITREVVLGTLLLVSMEPAGGSPTGAPTGPVVYGGVLETAD